MSGNVRTHIQGIYQADKDRFYRGLAEQSVSQQTMG